MRRFDALLLCAALLAVGCRSPSPESDSDQVNAVAGETQAKVELPPTELPEALPSNLSISYRIDTEAEQIDELKLTPGASSHTSARGRRHVSVTYAAPQTVLDAVYGTFRTHACDQVRSRVERSPARGGTIVQLRAGGVRNIINDRDKFFPEPRWVPAYKACATALDAAFPSRGETPAAQLRLAFAEKLSHAVNVSADLGPDLLGISWDDEQRVAVIDVATVRPVEVSLRSGKASSRTLVDLQTHAGLQIGLTEDTRALVVEPIEGAATRVGGEVPKGVDARTDAHRPVRAATPTAQPSGHTKPTPQGGEPGVGPGAAARGPEDAKPKDAKGDKNDAVRHSATAQPPRANNPAG